MICVSVNEPTAEGCISALRGLDFAEIRMDLMEPSELSEESIRRIFSQPLRLIATCRPGTLLDGKRKESLLLAIDSGAAYVDVEVEAADAYKKELVERAKARGCKVIMSYHDHRRTPAAEELRQIVGWCFASGADIAKIACLVSSERDGARLLGLLDSEKALVVVGMGKKGLLTRAAAPLLGSLFTFASLGEGKETADGQPGRERLERMLEALGGEG